MALTPHKKDPNRDEQLALKNKGEGLYKDKPDGDSVKRAEQVLKDSKKK